MARVSIKGIPELQRRLAETAKGPRDILRYAQLETVLRARASVPVRSGKTRSSIRPGGLTNSYARITVGGAARYIELGTRPHEIRPRTKRVLAWQDGGEWVFARRVHHPGQPARPFLVPAAKEAVNSVGFKQIVAAWNRGA